MLILLANPNSKISSINRMKNPNCNALNNLKVNLHLVKSTSEKRLLFIFIFCFVGLLLSQIYNIIFSHSYWMGALAASCYLFLIFFHLIFLPYKKLGKIQFTLLEIKIVNRDTKEINRFKISELSDLDFVLKGYTENDWWNMNFFPKPVNQLSFTYRNQAYQFDFLTRNYFEYEYILSFIRSWKNKKIEVKVWNEFIEKSKI